jgi:hypothetical protein
LLRRRIVLFGKIKVEETRSKIGPKVWRQSSQEWRVFLLFIGFGLLRRRLLLREAQSRQIADYPIKLAGVLTIRAGLKNKWRGHQVAPLIQTRDQAMKNLNSPSMLCLTCGCPCSSRLLIRHRQQERVAVNPAPNPRAAFRLNVDESGEPIHKDGQFDIRRLKTADPFLLRDDKSQDK